jgi:hypothetical protein
LKDPKRDECIKNSIETFIPSLRQKHSKFKFDTIEPFVLDALTINYKNTNQFSGQFNLKNSKMYGTSRFKLANVKSNFTEGKMEIRANFYFPMLLTSASYNSTIILNGVEVKSKGQFNLTMKQVSSKVLIKGSLKTIDGEEYMNVYKFDMTPYPKEMTFAVTGIFPDPTLSVFATFLCNTFH